MGSGRIRGRAHRVAVLAAGVGIVAVTSASLAAESASGGAGDHPIILAGAVYTGNDSCSSCHAEEKAKELTGQMIGDELGIWEAYDPHRTALKTLGNDESKAIAGKLGIAEATADSKCLSCHGMDVKIDFRGEQFDATDAVGCESCHGPAGGWKDDAARPGWLKPHEEAGWTAAQRKTLGARGLREKLGLIDTSHLTTRAERCVTCHLKIDKALLDAGHPRLEFELSAYSEYLYPWKKDFAIHWDDTLRGPMVGAKLWAVGQAVASGSRVDDAGLAAVYAKGLEIAGKHFEAADPEGLANATLTSVKCLAAARDLAESGAMARNQMEGEIIGFGVAALASSAVYARGPDGFIEDDVLIKPITLAASLDAEGSAEKREAFVAALRAVVASAAPSE